MGAGICFGPIGRGLVEPCKLSKLQALISCLGKEPVCGDKRHGPWAAGSVDAGIVFVLSWGAMPLPITGRNNLVAWCWNPLCPFKTEHGQ